MYGTPCEAPDCTMPGTVCYACQECLCWRHKNNSSCEICHKLITQGSLEQRLSRCMGIGLSLLLSGVLILFLPRDDNNLILELAVLLVIFGAMLIWLGLIAHISLRD